MNFNYKDILSRSESLSREFEELVNVLSESEWSEKANEKSWTLLEVIQHLNIIYEIYLPKFQETLKSVGPRHGEISPDKRSFLGKLAIKMTAPKNGRRNWKMKTLKFLEPKTNPADLSVILESFRKNKTEFNRIITLCESVNVGGVKMATSLGDRVKLFVPECLEFVLVHEERHFLQIRELADLLETHR